MGNRRFMGHSSLVVVLGGYRQGVPTLQEFFFFLFLSAFGRALRVVLLHVLLFLSGQLRQVTNEEDQPPTVFVVGAFACLAPSWHSSQADAVLDDVVELAVGRLCVADRRMSGDLG